jgi:hypothetical protein
VYEVLYKKYGNNINYNNVDLHKYCDATGDIDIKLFFPQLQINDRTRTRHPVISFFNRENKINSFFNHFTGWIFKVVADTFSYNEIIRDEARLNEMFPNTVDFDIDEYDQIDEAVKNYDYGFRYRKVGNFYVVGYYEDSMFKTQIICKVVKNGITVIDHLLEFVCSYYFNLQNGYKVTPEKGYPDILSSSSNDLFNANYLGSFESQIKQLLIRPFSFSNLKQKYKQDIYIQTYTKLIDGNISGYNDRYTFISNPDDPKLNGKLYRHKGLNHVARLFYLFELFYQNENLLNDTLISEQNQASIKQRSENFLLHILQLSNSGKPIGLRYTTELITWLKSNPILYYYKIINGYFHIIKVSFKTFFLAYLNILSLKARNTGNVLVTRPYNDKFWDLIQYLKTNKVNFIPSDIYLINEQFVRGRRSQLDIIHFDRYHQIFMDKIFDNRPSFNLQPSNPDMAVSKIQNFWKKNKSRKNHKLFGSDVLLSRYTASSAIKDVFNNFDKIHTNKAQRALKTQFDKDIYDINTRRLLEIENRRKQHLAAKKIQKAFKTFKNKKRTSIKSSSGKIKSSAAKKIQHKFRSFTKKRR